jgi:hypothetical protein
VRAELGREAVADRPALLELAAGLVAADDAPEVLIHEPIVWALESARGLQPGSCPSTNFRHWVLDLSGLGLCVDDLDLEPQPGPGPALAPAAEVVEESAKREARLHARERRSAHASRRRARLHGREDGDEAVRAWAARQAERPG